MTPSFWGSYDRSLCTGGLSKAYGLPGLRTGWVVGSPEMAERLWGYHDYTSIGPSMMTDRLASIALEPRRRDWILNRTRKYLHGRGWHAGRLADRSTRPSAAYALWI